MARQKNDPQMRKRPGAKLPQACGFILPPWPGYPLLGCSSAEPNSVSPGNRKHTLRKRRAGSDTSQTRPPGNTSIVAVGYQPNAPTGSRQSGTRKIRSNRPLPTCKFEEITGRNPTNHWLVSTRPSVAGFNAPRDTYTETSPKNIPGTALDNKISFRDAAVTPSPRKGHGRRPKARKPSLF